jgi:guanylate kinase
MTTTSNSTSTASTHYRKHRGRLFIVSAPSGAGKTTLCRAAMLRCPNLAYSISYTTRPQREGETHGIDYYFISRREFEEGIESGKWLEWAFVHDHFYGTSRDQVEHQLGCGRDILLDIDVNGCAQIVKQFPESITIFIMPPSLSALRKRLENRRTDAPEIIARRLETAKLEIARKDLYRHIVINDRLDEATERFVDILCGPAPGNPPHGPGPSDSNS